MTTEKLISISISEDPLSAKLLENIKQTKPNLKCNVCKSNAVAVLCITCTIRLCKECHNHHGNDSNEHNIVPVDKIHCPEHNKNFEYYCKKCHEFACPSCKVKHSSGDTHNLVAIAIEEMHIAKSLWAKIVDPINEALYQTESKLTTAQKSLDREFTQVIHSMNKHCEELPELQERRDQLEGELLYIASQKKSEILKQLINIKSTQNQVISFVNKLFDDLKVSSDLEVSTVEIEMELHIQKLKDHLKNLSLVPDLFMLDAATKAYEIFGCDLTTGMSLSEIRNLPRHFINKETFEFLILAKDKKNQYCTIGGSHVFIEFPLGDVEWRDNNDGTYTVSLKPKRVGVAKLSAYIDNQKIKGSPFSIEVLRRKVEPTNTINCDGIPWGIAIARNDMWAVTDKANHCVCIFSSQDQLVQTFGQKGNGKVEFNEPLGLVFDRNNYLYVVDSGNHRVQKFDTTGKYLLEFGTKGNGEGELQDPFGITAHLDRIYVADFHNKRISVFQTDGSFCLSFGSKYLSSPRDVAIGTDDDLFVADHYNHRICIFKLNGDFKYEFGKHGSSEGDINHPYSIATNNKEIFITDKNFCVSVFSQDGEYMHCLGYSYRAAKGQVSCPHGVASKWNSVYVTDLTKQTVQRFLIV